MGRKRVREWDRDYSALLAQNAGARKKKRKLRPPTSTRVDEAVFEFLEEECAEGRAVSNKQLVAHARQCAAGLQLEGFRPTNMWLRGWKRRFGVGMRCGTNASQKVPADFADQLTQFRKAVIRCRKTHSITPSAIYNMDQTMVRFDMPSKRTNHKKGSKDVRVKTTKAEKKGFTVALGASATGEKLPAAIFFKEYYLHYQ